LKTKCREEKADKEGGENSGKWIHSIFAFFFYIKSFFFLPRGGVVDRAPPAPAPLYMYFDFFSAGLRI
jgi:hypothetical protein